MKNRDISSDYQLNIKNSEEALDFSIRALHNLMPFKVREILLVSSLYDAFIMEEEGLIAEMVIWEYRHLLLSSPPRVTHVTSGIEAISKLKIQQYDLVITMTKNIGMDPYDFGKKIKKLHPKIPIILLATDTADLHFCQENVTKKGIDKSFFWYGDTSLFMAIIKYVEDKINAKYDTINSNVQIIIIIEDSIRDYSIRLPIIYSKIVQQIQRSISEDLNEMQRLIRRKARPKILLTDNYEDGIKVFKEYKEYVLGVISDVRFSRKGQLDSEAGYKFAQFLKEQSPDLPVMLQSTDKGNQKKAEKLGSFFVYKNSQTLKQDFDNFLLKHLGFGDFIFLLPKIGKDLENKNKRKFVEINRASNLKEFEASLQKIPLESIRFHANRNDFSKWLMARGEFKLAIKLRPQKVSDFKTLDDMRSYLVNVFNESRREKQLSVMTDFSQQKFEFDSSYTKIGGESLGGKGRGIAFIRTMLTRYNIQEKYPDVKIVVPSTIAIATEYFDEFINRNKLNKFAKNSKKIKDEEIAEAFIKGNLSDNLIEKIKVVIKHFKKPLAIRSSSLLEDSQNHPFAGIYSTYMLPNNDKNENTRLKQLCEAIKLVYASVFYKNAKTYIESTSAKIEEEKMAIIIQELIGNNFNGRFYPTFSGVAQSYNYYPISHQKREDGIVSLALGLGYSVVGGEKVLRYSPKYPDIIPDFSTPDSIFENSQKELYVLNTKKTKFKLNEKEFTTLEKISISNIFDNKSLKYLVSTYDIEDGIVRDGFSKQAPLLVTFAGILKYDMFPLTDILKDILEAGAYSMGSPVEIEFAVNFNQNNNKPPVFAIIQIRPLVLTQEHLSIHWDENEVRNENVLIYSSKTLGNGIIETIKDIIFVPHETFDSSKTNEIAREIGKMNKTMNGMPYLLIGPGRWGTQDRWLGIPIIWREISNVKVIVETAFDDFNITPTQGTHFFQNIISKGIGYINVTLDKKEGLIDWHWLKNIKPERKLKYTKHIKLSKPLTIKLDGRIGRALVIKP
jgi:CheY-like chemotaxis protein